MQERVDAPIALDNRTNSEKDHSNQHVGPLDGRVQYKKLIILLSVRSLFGLTIKQQ